MKHILTIISTVVLFLFPATLSAQQTVMRGTISDDLGPLMGAQVFLQNQDERIVKGTTTGPNGEYLLDVPQNEGRLTIGVSYVGYKTISVPYTGQTTYNAQILPSVTMIGEITIEADADDNRDMMSGIATEDIGYASEKIDITQFEDMAVVSVEEMLQGRIANLDIVQSSGDPGSVASIRIRGTSSLSANNEPLIVIDGVPQDTEIDPDFDFGDADVESFGSLVNISPSDIENIEVLKDATATVQWGPKAANGVLLITTKRGGKHKPMFRINQKFTYEFQPKPIAMLRGPEYTTLIQDAMWNWIKDGSYMNSNLDQLRGSTEILYDPNYRYFNEFSQDTDWVDLVTRSALNSDTSFQMSGGGDKATYLFSLTYLKNEGTTVGFGFDRITSRLNVTYSFSRKFRVSSDFSYQESTRDEVWKLSDTAVNEDLRLIAIRKMPNLSPWVLDEDGNPTDEYFVPPLGVIQTKEVGNQTPNPLALANESVNRTYARNISASFYTQLEILPGLIGMANVAFTMQTMRYDRYLPESALNIPWTNDNYNRGVEALNNKVTSYLNFRLLYNKRFGANKYHTFNASINDQINTSNDNAYSITTAGNGAKEVSSPSSGGKIIKLSSEKNIKRSIGISGSLHYKYRDLYAITFSARSNAESQAGSYNRWKKPRPAVSGVWKIHNEPFVKPATWIKNMVLNLSWGRTENIQNSNRTNGTYAAETNYMYMAALKPAQMQLERLESEVKTSITAGWEGTFFNKEKLTLGFEIYQDKTTNLLQNDAAIPTSVGFSQVKSMNSGAMLNRGWSIRAGLKDIIKIGDFRVSVNNFNISRNVNKMLELWKNQDAERYTVGNGNVARKLVIGTPVGAIYGFLFDGINQNWNDTYARDASGNLIRDVYGNPVVTMINATGYQRPGDARYVDVNNDANINEYDLVYLGNSWPTLSGGGSLQLNYKDFSLRASVHFRLKYYVFNKTRLTTEQMGSGGNNQSTNALSRWRYEGEDTEIPRALWGNNNNSLVSDKYVEDASFFKLKDVTLTYRVPQKVLDKIGLNQANITLTTYNILTLTKYTGVDPEVGMDGYNPSPFRIATDSSRTPPTKKVALSLTVGF